MTLETAVLPQVVIETQGRIRDDRFWGHIRHDGRTYEWRATLQGYDQAADGYRTRVDMPCADVIIMDSKHAVVKPGTETMLIEALREHYHGLHDETAGWQAHRGAR